MFYKEAVIRALEQSGGEGRVRDVAVKASWIMGEDNTRWPGYDSMVEIIWDMVDTNEIKWIPTGGVALHKEHVFGN